MPIASERVRDHFQMRRSWLPASHVLIPFPNVISPRNAETCPTGLKSASINLFDLPPPMSSGAMFVSLFVGHDLGPMAVGNGVVLTPRLVIGFLCRAQGLELDFARFGFANLLDQFDAVPACR